MNLYRFIRRSKPGQLWKLVKLCAANLSRVWPTWMATKKSVAYATKYYGKLHQKNTPANAFRHALWSYLIIKKCLKSKEPKDDVIDWAIKITDMHEDLFPNKSLARAMDLHNNHLGVHYFDKWGYRQELEIVMFFKDLTKESIKVENIEELEMISKDRMVYIENMDTI